MERMNIIMILLIFFLTFTTINCNNLTCVDNTNCKCLIVSDQETHLYCLFNKTRKFAINIRQDKFKITCENWNGWKDLNFTSEFANEKMSTVEIQKCGLSDEISLKDVIERFGIEEAGSLIFRSARKLNGTLKKEHLSGFSKTKTIDLSGNGLTNLPKDLFIELSDVEWIDLTDNEIILPDEIFDYNPKITRLDLFNNGLKTFNVKLINKLEKLVYLDLMNNLLTYLDDALFDNVVSLKTLILSMNNLSDLSSYIFFQLRQLDVLDISMNNFYSIPVNLLDENKKLNQFYLNNNKRKMYTLPDYLLANLTNLEEVFLYNNGFQSLPENLFWGSSMLRVISMNKNDLTTLPVNLFKNLTNLNELQIGSNLIENLPDGIFKDLQNLHLLDLSKNKMIYISKNLFDGLTSLISLSMSNNNLKIIEPTAFEKLHILTIVQLSNNNINFNFGKAKWNPFYNNTNLEEVYLANNSIDHFISYWPDTEDNLKILDLSYNNITKIMADDFLIPSTNIKIDLSNNKIQSIVFNIKRRDTKFYNVVRDIIITIDNNPILCDCYLYDLLRWREKKIMNMYYNFFKLSVGDMSCVKSNGKLGPRIKRLRASTYSCSEEEYFNRTGICPDKCTCNIRLSDMMRFMDCSNKGLANFVINQNNVILEDGYPLAINLSGNFLKEMPSLEVLSEINVTTLILSNNNISEIILDRIPKYLEVLHLHNNNITKVNLDVIRYLKKGSLKEFTFSGNPIKCDCNAHDLFLFILSMRYEYKDLANIMCNNNISTPLYLMDFHDLICQPKIHGFSKAIAGLVISLSIGMLLAMIILIWYFRKDIRTFIPDSFVTRFVNAFAPTRLI